MGGGTFHQFRTTNKKIICRTEPLEAASECVWDSYNSFRLPSSHTPPLHLSQRAPGRCREEDSSSRGSRAQQPRSGALTGATLLHELSFRRAKGLPVFPSSGHFQRNNCGSVKNFCPRRNPFTNLYLSWMGTLSHHWKVPLIKSSNVSLLRLTSHKVKIQNPSCLPLTPLGKLLP